MCALAAGGTIYWARAMHDQSMMWMASPLVFVTIWTVMMVAMMLPSLVPVLRRYPHGFALAAGYFLVWAAFGAGAYVAGMLLMRALSGSPALAQNGPFWAGAALLVLGLVQFSPWKLRHLTCCRACAPGSARHPGHVFRDGLLLGWHCCRCCTALMALLFVLGMMRLEVIALVGVLIAAERLAPRPVAVVRAVGVLILAAGAIVMARH